MKVKCIDNSGNSSSYGLISNIIELNEVVEVIYSDGCCYKILKDNGEEYLLNKERFQ